MTYLPDIHRLLPQSPEAEQGVLSSLLLAPKEVFSMCEQSGIDSRWFHIPAHAEVYEVLRDIFQSQDPKVDFIRLTQALRDRDKLESVGGVGFISSLWTFLTTAANAAYYIGVAAEKFVARELVRIGTECAAMAYDSGEDVRTLAATAHSALTALLVEKKKRQSVKECLKEIMQEMASGKPDGEVVPTGIGEIDEKLQLYKGDLLIVSAPTSCGKSALTAQMLLTACMDRGLRVAFYPLEMRQKQTIKRGLAMRAGINVKYVRSLLLSAKTAEAERYAQEQLKKVQDAVMDMARANLYIRDDLYALDSIIADIRAEHGKAPFTFVGIDYLQLIRINGKFERRQLQIAEITQRLKMLANELDCVVIVPSQQNKTGGTREAEDAENDASALVKIDAEVADNGDISPGRISVWKQREGARGIDLKLKFNGLLTKFEPLTP